MSVKYTQEQKDEVLRMRDQGMTYAQIAKAKDMSEMTVRTWEKDRNNGSATTSTTGSTNASRESEPKVPVRDLLKSMGFELALVKLQNKHLLKYSKAVDDSGRSEIEIKYLLGVVGLFNTNNWPIKRLPEIEEEKEDQQGEQQGEQQEGQA